MESTTDDVGLCWGCGYSLRGIESRRCPECGREFDPADVRSTNRGRVMGRVGRALIRPVSPLLVLLGLVASVLVLVVSRMPVYGLHGWFVDVPYYLKWGDWKVRFAAAGWRDGVYLAGLLMWGVVVLAWWVGTMVRWVVLRRYRVPAGVRVRVWRRHLLLLLLMLLTVGMVGAGWPYRLGMAMVTREFGADAGLTQSAEDVLPEMSVERRRAALWSAVRYARSSRERLMALRVIIEYETQSAPAVLDDALGRESDPAMKAWELRLAALYQGPAWAEVVGKYLDDPDSGVRAAAADALGLLYGGLRTGQRRQDGYYLPTTTSDPPIGLPRLQVDTPAGDFRTEPPPDSMPEVWKERLASLMTGAATRDEREAAARAISGREMAGYRLRLAEWGVWMVDGTEGRLSSQLSDLPPIVHEVGESAATLSQQGWPPSKRRVPRVKLASSLKQVMLKPVIHLTANRPMAVDLSMVISYGRPWYVYPQPDDFCFDRGMGIKVSMQDQDPAGLKGLAKSLRPGYPWLESGIGISSGGYAGQSIVSTGFRWQGLIVSPTKLSWMKPAEVGSDAHFAWWKRLRNVDCSWVSNCGESERFLYYDGPTGLRCPVRFGLEGGRLVVSPMPFQVGDATFGQGGDQAPGNLRDALMVRMKDGVLSVEQMRIPMGGETGHTKWPARPIGEKVPEAAFLKLIMAHGLTESEAKGMEECWRKAFFETEGVRVLMLLSAQDYEEFCPMTVRPDPTEKARVGMIWCELE